MPRVCLRTAFIFSDSVWLSMRRVGIEIINSLRNARLFLISTRIIWAIRYILMMRLPSGMWIYSRPILQRLSNNSKKKKICCRLYPRPPHFQKVASSYVDESEFENTERHHRRGLYLPSTTNISDEDVMYVAQEVVHAIS